MKHPFSLLAAMLLAVALLPSPARAADADVTGLVPTAFMDFDSSNLSNKGSASFSFTSEGTATYVSGANGGMAINTSVFTPYSSKEIPLSTAGGAFTLSLVMNLGTNPNGITLNLRNEAAEKDLIVRRGATAGSLVVGVDTWKVATRHNLQASFEDDSAWHLVSIVVEEAGVSLYVDGDFVGSMTDFTLWSSSGHASRFQFGSHLSGLPSGEARGGGCIDDLRIHDAVLTPAQMKAIAIEYGILLPEGSIRVEPSGDPTVGKDSFSTAWSLSVGGNDTAAAAIVYGTDAALSSPKTNAIGSALATDTYMASLSGLAAGTTYWWKIVASNGVNWAETTVASFRTFDPIDFTGYIPITVSGYTGASTLTNFPVLVKLADNAPSGFDYADCAEYGSDLRFTDADGVVLPHEIDTWNANGESFVWVGIPVLTNGTTFTMYYGSNDPGAPATTGVWGSYVGVWHMNTTSPADASGFGNNGTAVGSPAVAAGEIGSAVSLPSTSDYVTCGTALANSKLAPGFTVEGWANPDVTSGKLTMFGKSDFISVRIDEGNIVVTTPNISNHGAISAPISAGTWFHWAMTFVPGSDGLKFYANGVLVSTQTASSLPNTTGLTKMWLGRNQWDEAYLGLLDEMRLSCSIRSADWIKAAYDTAATPATFAVPGPAESTDSDLPRFGALGASDENGTATFSVALATPGFGGHVPTAVSVFYGTDGENWTELPLGETNETATLTGSASGFAGNARVLWYATATATQDSTTKSMTSAQRSLVTKALDPAGNYKSFTATVDWNGSPAANIPVALRLSEAAVHGFSYADVTASGFEILDEDGLVLPYEIDTWNTNGESLLWVKMPSYADGATITVRYGSAFANTCPDATNVWANYVAVWHMNEILEDPATDLHYTPDSSANGWHAYKAAEADEVPAPVTTAAGATAHPVPITGTAMNIGYGTGKSNDNLGGFVVPASATASTTLNGPGFTLSAIVNAHHKAVDGRCRVIAFGNTYTDKANLAVGYDDIYCMGSNEHHRSNPGGATNWVCLTTVYGSSSFIYANGTNLSGNGGNPNLPSLTLDKGIGLGSFTDGKQCLNGYLDEARIRNAASTADYIAAEYHAMADGDALVCSAVASSDTSAPVLGAPTVVRNQDGSFTVSVEVSENAPDTIFCKIGGTNYAMTTAAVAIPATYSVTVSDLAAGTYTASVQASSESGTTVSATCPTAFHAGALVVTAPSNADEGTLSPGTFRIARADADPTDLPAITFDVAFTGDGVDAVEPPGVTSLTIPAGAAYVELTITPVLSEAVTEDADLVLVVSGAYVGQSSSATMTIVNATFDPAVRYVATAGDDANHGGTPELPKKTIAAAVSSLASIAQSRICTVHVAPGLYKISKPIVVTNAIHVVGDDPDPSRTFVSNTVEAGYYTQDQRIFRINHPDAVVANLTMQHGQEYGSGGNLHIGSAGGMVSNCVIEAGYTRDNGKAGGAWLDAGVVTHTVFRKNNTSSGTVWWNGTTEGVLHLGGNSRAENCLFTENSQWVTVTLISVGGSATLRNCSILDSGLSATNADYSVWSALKIDSGATVQNVVVAGITNKIDGAACPPTGSVAQFQNSAFDGDVSALPAGTVAGTAAEFFPHYSENVPYAVKYRPKSGGPLYDKGANYTPMAAFDLSGTQKRLVGSRVDIGCYEANGAGTVLLLK